MDDVQLFRLRKNFTKVYLLIYDKRMALDTKVFDVGLPQFSSNSFNIQHSVKGLKEDLRLICTSREKRGCICIFRVMS
jgi:hypothetical protein